MVKKFFFRGKSLEELQALPIDEFIPLLDARARRYLIRLPVKYKKLISKVKKTAEEKVIKTHMRDAVILPQWIGKTFGIHNGKEFKQIKISLEMVGQRLGVFAHTTGRVAHSGPGVGATRGSKFMPLK